MTDNILTEIERIIKENEELKTRITELEVNNHNILMRERLYQSALSSAKSQISKDYYVVYGANDNDIQTNT